MRFIAALFLSLSIAFTAQADLIIDVQDASIAAGQDFTVDVLISSTSSDAIDLASYVFVVSNVGAPSSSIEFLATQLTSENGEASYLFSEDLDPTALDFPVSDPTRLEGNDFTDSGDPITITGTQELLVRLDMRHVLTGALATALGDQFNVVLIEDGVDPDLTLFDNDTTGIEATIDGSSFDVNGIGGGLITVTAVPEPSSLAVLTLVGTAATWRRRRQQNNELRS